MMSAAQRNPALLVVRFDEHANFSIEKRVVKYAYYTTTNPSFILSHYQHVTETRTRTASGELIGPHNIEAELATFDVLYELPRSALTSEFSTAQPDLHAMVFVVA